MSVRRRQPAGFMLLLGLLVLAAVIAMAAGLASAILADVATNRTFNDAAVAYFAAESGIEHGLYTVRQYRQTGQNLEEAGSGTIPTLDSYQNIALSTAPAQYSVDGSLPRQYTVRLLENDSVTVDLFDPDQVASGAGVDVIGVGGIDLDAANSDTPWIEVTLLELDPSNPGQPIPQTLLEGTLGVASVALSVASCTPTTLCTLDQPDPGRNYRVRLKAVYDGVANLTLRAYRLNPVFPPPGEPVDLQGQVVVKGIGRSPRLGQNSAEQAITATTNWLVGPSPLFDYTLFSEEGLEKR